MYALLVAAVSFTWFANCTHRLCRLFDLYTYEVTSLDEFREHMAGTDLYARHQAHTLQLDTAGGHSVTSGNSFSRRTTSGLSCLSTLGRRSFTYSHPGRKKDGYAESGKESRPLSFHRAPFMGAGWLIEPGCLSFFVPISISLSKRCHTSVITFFGKRKRCVIRLSPLASSLTLRPGRGQVTTKTPDSWGHRV